VYCDISDFAPLKILLFYDIICKSYGVLNYHVMVCYSTSM